MIRRFLGSPLWGEVQSAETVFTEYPLAHVDSGASPDCLSRGVADLVYRGAAGWSVVDYKSDRCSSPLPAHLPSTHPYAQQVQTYARGLRAAVEAPLHRTGVWFADAGTLVSVPA
jgi:ATP-dependent helicase/nuclease subunit A